MPSFIITAGNIHKITFGTLVNRRRLLFSLPNTDTSDTISQMPAEKVLIFSLGLLQHHHLMRCSVGFSIVSRVPRTSHRPRYRYWVVFYSLHFVFIVFFLRTIYQPYRTFRSSNISKKNKSFKAIAHTSKWSFCSISLFVFFLSPYRQKAITTFVCHGNYNNNENVQWSIHFRDFSFRIMRQLEYSS